MDFQKGQDRRRAFDCFCKKVLKHEARDYYDEVRRLGELETSFTELSEKEFEQLCAEDEYFAKEQIFNVSGMEIVVKDESIAEALLNLPEQDRGIVLLYYFLDMTDQAIGDKLDMPRPTVRYKRVKALKQLKNLKGGQAYE